MSSPNWLRDRISRGNNTERTVFFCDAVIAIAITLLVIELKVPEVEDPSTELVPALMAESSQFGAFVISFLVLGLNWITHHKIFSVIERYNGRLQQLNLLFLFFVAILPFTTALISEYGADGGVAAAAYGGAVGAMFLVEALIWFYAYKAGLMASDIQPNNVRDYAARICTLALPFLISVPLFLIFRSNWVFFVWMASFIIVPILYPLFTRIVPAPKLPGDAQRRGG